MSEYIKNTIRIHLPANLELRKLMESLKADLRVAVRAEMWAILILMVIS